MSFNDKSRETLQGVALDSIQWKLQNGEEFQVDLANYVPELREWRSCFVTLEKQGELCGCIGSIQPHQSLVQEVSHNACAAAFNDPRFPPLEWEDIPYLSIHLSILSPVSTLFFDSEEDLLQKLRPGIDGLILKDGWKQGTFIPAVWESLPNPQQFLRHLKRKAGLPEDYWSNTIEIQRFQVE